MADEVILRITLPRRINLACIEAIRLAKLSERYRENDGKHHPLVGAVILDAAGRILSRGARRQDRKNHAEVVAISKLRRSDISEVHTVVTTLEPCSYRNNTEHISCAKSIVHIGAKQVVIGSLDPAASVRGRGAHIMQLRHVYFTMFPQSLHELVMENNKAYVDIESEPCAGGGLNQGRDLNEFDLDYSPPRVITFLTSAKFWRLMKDHLRNFRTLNSDIEFPRYFSSLAASGQSGVRGLMETDPMSSSLFELVAKYLAYPRESNSAELDLNRHLVYKAVAEWWQIRSTKHREPLRNKLRSLQRR